ncbi:hypothetical protein [Sphingobacterium bovistauri]|uniref:SusD family protein n=1 Tax=Sphingobacterium bovistauri TaxID=2781959 RepID=A0ABS7Z2F9_9SPHI|nr:hypothetical protein [Sphingobacterium bovistauri]MCA5004350.1 hypothetical protein [Sphingobacterium bovistauri]
MKRYKYILVALMISTFLKSCDLERFPMDSIEQSQSFDKVSDAEKWSNNFYAQLRGRVYGTYTQVSDVQSDVLNATIEFGNNIGSPHRWSDDFNSDSYEISNVWLGYYGALKNINLSIGNSLVFQRLQMLKKLK